MMADHAPVSPWRIGLTGGIGSGKSTVAARLAQCGAAVIDTDVISRELTAAGGAAMPAIAEAFGADLVAADGALDRERMRSLAFREPEARARLQAIVHPMVGLRAAALAQAAAQAGAVCLVFDVPLLVESGHWRARVDRVLVVDCLEATQIERVGQRSGLTESAVRDIMRAQATRVQRLLAADFVLYNEGLSIASLHAQVDHLAQTFGLSLPATKAPA